MKQENMQVVGTPATTDAQKSSVLWGVPDDVLVLLKQYNFEGHDAPTYTVTGSPNGLHFIVVWPTKDSNLGDKVLQDIMEIHQITQRETKEISTQTDSADSTYASGDSCDELDVDIEDDNHSRSKLSISSADSGHAESGHALMQVDQEQSEEPMPVGRHHLEHLIKKDLDAVESDIEEIDGEAKKAPISPQGFTPFTPYAPSQIDRFRQMATNPVSSYAQQFQNMHQQYSNLAMLNHQAMQRQLSHSALIAKSATEFAVGQTSPVHHPIVSMGEPNVRQHLNEIYRKYNIVPKRIQGGTLEEVLRPPLKSQGHRTAHQIHLMRRMREVSSKMNLTDCTNPNYEDAVSVLLDSFEITAPYVNASDYRRKMNFLLRKRINNRRWFLRKKAKGAANNDETESSPAAVPSPVEVKTEPTSSPGFAPHPGLPTSASHLLSHMMRPVPSLTIGGTPMIDSSHNSAQMTVK